jgi:hypothetical protein
MNTEHDLTTRLAREAERFDRLGGSALEIGQVLDRAGEIRRARRMRATVVMAAVVLAVAVPTAVVATKGHHDRPVTPAHQSKADTSPLTVDGLDAGPAPATGWFEHEVWTGPDGTRLQISGGSDPAAVASVGDSLLVATAEENGMRVTLAPPAGGTAGPAPSWPIDGALAVSRDGTLGAFVRPDGTPVVVREDGTDHELPAIPRGSSFDAAAVSGDCADSCTVWVSSRGERPESWTSTPRDGSRRLTAAVQTVTDVDSAGGLVAGIVEVRPDLTTCSAVESAVSRSPTWTTCDFRLTSFSPDETHVLAFGSIGDGLGDTELAVLDASSGTVRLHLRTADQAFIHQAVWEDDSHVLATVFQGGQWAVLRIGLDGEREYAVGPAPGEDMESPFVLPTR